LLEWASVDRFLDVGCGPGSYLALVRRDHPGVQAVGCDLSPGMAAEASAHASTVVGDAAVLPFPPSTFDAVIAPHMLYHCPDIAAAARELRRVLRDGGAMVAVTNGDDHLRELWELHASVTGKRAPLSTDRFKL